MWTEIAKMLAKMLDLASSATGQALLLKWVQKADEELAELKALDERVKASQPPKPPGVGT